jgi:hypothetical protein
MSESLFPTTRVVCKNTLPWLPAEPEPEASGLVPFRCERCGERVEGELLESLSLFTGLFLTLDQLAALDRWALRDDVRRQAPVDVERVPARLCPACVVIAGAEQASWES